MVYEFSKRIYKEQFGKILTILSIFCGLVIFCTSTAFADDDMSLLTEQGLLDVDPVSVNDTEPFSVQDQDAMIHQVADKIAYDLQESGLLSDTGTKAQDYVYSIYLYLQNTIHPDLTSIKNTLQNGIYSDTSNIDTKLGYVLEILQGNTSAPVNTYSTSFQKLLIDLWFSLTTPNIYNSTSPSVLGSLNLIYSSMHNAAGTSDIFSEVSGINSANSAIASSAASIANSSASSLSQLQTLVAQNTITWRDRSSSFIGYSLSLDNINIISNPSNYSVGQHYIYALYNSSGLGYNRPYVFHVFLPVQSSTFPLFNLPDIQLYTEYETDHFNEITINYDYRILTSRRGIDIFYTFQVPVTTSYRYAIRVNNINYIYNTNQSSEMLFYGDNGYLEYLEFIKQDNLYNNLDKLTNELASDDIIAAKEASKPQIDEALNSFTGSGSGAASVSDISGAKGVSSSLKSGLATGESSSTALTVFNPANAFYGWFSQDNANYFTVYTPSRSLNNWDNIEWTDDEVKLIPVIEQNIYSLVGNER